MILFSTCCSSNSSLLLSIAAHLFSQQIGMLGLLEGNLTLYMYSVHSLVADLSYHSPHCLSIYLSTLSYSLYVHSLEADLSYHSPHCLSIYLSIYHICLSTCLPLSILLLPSLFSCYLKCQTKHCALPPPSLLFLVLQSFSLSLPTFLYLSRFFISLHLQQPTLKSLHHR